MQLSDIYLGLGEETFSQLVRGISIGKLKTYQLYDRVKARFHLPKLNSETLRKAAPRMWARITERDEEFATDLAQTILVSHLDMIREILDFNGVPHEDGFFAKDADVASHLTEGWQQRTLDHFGEKHGRAIVLFYINHLGWELTKTTELFAPAAA